LRFVRTLDTFDSFEISDLEKLTNLAKDGVTMLQARGTLSGMEFLRITTVSGADANHHTFKTVMVFERQ
jgi:hypothetical protein